MTASQIQYEEDDDLESLLHSLQELLIKKFRRLESKLDELENRLDDQGATLSDIEDRVYELEL